MQEDEHGRIENLKKTLYSRVDRTGQRRKKFEFQRDDITVDEAWREENPPGNIDMTRKNAPFVKKLFLFSMLFFFLCLFLGFFIFFRGSNIVSSSNIEIAVAGAPSVAGGEELVLEIAVTNSNNTALEFADLKVTFPDGSREPGNISEELKRYHESLGEIRSGGTVRRKVRVVLFGEEDSKKEISTVLEYRLKGSNAIFEKEKKLEIAISSAPVTLAVSGLKEVNSNQTVELTVDVTSNSSELLKGMLIKADYAFGFKYETAFPKPAYDNNVWNIGDLAPGTKKTIRIQGKIEGQDGEERNFHFEAGIKGKKNEKELEPVFLSTVHTIVIKKPFVSAQVLLNGSADPIYAAVSGREIKVDVLWENNLTTAVRNAEISVKLPATFIDHSSVKGHERHYRSADNAIVLDQTTIRNLERIDPCFSGLLSFYFKKKTIPKDYVEPYRNAEVPLEVMFSGKRPEDANVPEKIKITERKIRLNTEATLSAQILYNGGSFQNRGPLPPKANEETTYTVVWSISNSINTVRGAKVAATLPSYVKWLATYSPQNEQVAYNPVNGSVVWTVCDIQAGAGYSGRRREIAFQVVLTPSVSQIGTTPTVVAESVLSGIDSFANVQVQSQRGSLSTKL